jgi:hypothetical protein
MGRSAVFSPYDIFYFVLVEGGRGTLEAVVQWSLLGLVGLSRSPETEVYTCPRGQ